MESGAHYRVRPRPRPRIFTWLCCSQQSRRQKHARYESIHKAAQYKNSGAIEIGIINESEMITAGVKEDFQGLRRAAHRKEMRTKLHYLANAEEVRPLHESIVTIPQRASGFDRLGEIY